MGETRATPLASSNLGARIVNPLGARISLTGANGSAPSGAAGSGVPATVT
jgi:hypothetical protein